MLLYNNPMVYARKFNKKLIKFKRKIGYLDFIVIPTGNACPTDQTGWDPGLRDDAVWISA
jgi:hypothetical protein